MVYNPAIYGELFDLPVKEYYPMNTAFNQLLNWIILPEICLLMMLFSTVSKPAGFAGTACRICVLLKYFPAVKMFVWHNCLCFYFNFPQLYGFHAHKFNTSDPVLTVDELPTMYSYELNPFFLRKQSSL